MGNFIKKPKPDSVSFEDLDYSIRNGYLKIPQFQRKFVWSLDQSARLLDSIIKGYPIGTFILWKTRERLRAVKNIGEIDLPATPDGDTVQYVLDGHQRITSIYAALKGATVRQDGKPVDYSNIYIDLKAGPGEPIVIAIENPSEAKLESVCKIVWLLKASRSEQNAFVDAHPDIPDAEDKIDRYIDAIKGYRFSTVLVENADINTVTEIFTRINDSGKRLTSFEIMVAKTYDEAREFDLSEKRDALNAELKEAGFDTISDSTILQSVAICLKKDVRGRTILALDKAEFIDAWEPVAEALKSAVDYCKTAYGVAVSNLLPYEALLTLLTYYFYRCPKRPEGDRQRWLRDYFWRSIWNERFSSSSDSNINADVAVMDSILDDRKPVLPTVMLSVDYLKMHGGFSPSSAFIKGILCILASQNPTSFVDGTKVVIDNDWLKQSNSKNYHHFFPRAYMKKYHPEVEEWRVNHIANITVVSDHDNKRKIRDRAPSKYIGEFGLQNPNIGKDLESHLITYCDADDSGIGADDYDTFFRKRLGRILDEFKARLILTENDSMQ